MSKWQNNCQNGRQMGDQGGSRGIKGDQGGSRGIEGHRCQSEISNLESRICNRAKPVARRYLITVIFFDPAARPLTMI